MHPLRVFAQVVIPQATRIALPNIGSMFIGMVKDTSTFSVIGMVELTYTVQNIESTTFQPFVLYTALAGIYVVAAFAIDFVFRAIEKALTTPPKGRLSSALTSRRRRRLELMVERLEAAV
jgi:ABC-type amino acid transport system permease subunit